MTSFVATSSLPTVTLTASQPLHSLQPAESPDILQRLGLARTKEDVRELIMQHGYESVASQWKHLPVVQQGALALARNFDGAIIHEFSEPGAGQPDAL
jgi:hypothetical protein